MHDLKRMVFVVFLVASSRVDLAQEPGSRIRLMEATIPELQKAMENGTLTSVGLVRWYLARIEAYDRKGPRLSTMLYINPNAVAEAESLDRERKEKGSRGPLHGIPMVLKDNFDTHDMPTTGGSLALVGLFPPDDAFQVRKLREAGVVIMGKTNLHELAAGITTVSSLGGQTRNPYDPRRNPGGSSGGTAAAVAANFAVAGMGSDTCGSIRIPASYNNLVGLRGTRGLSSRDGIIPLSHTQDIGGPLARTVTDLALILDATVGYDPNDPVTQLGRDRIPESFTRYLDREGLNGARIGILRMAFGSAQEDKEVADLVLTAAEVMKSQGAELVDIQSLGLEEMLKDASTIDHEFKFDLMDYLESVPGTVVRSLGDILERGLHHQALRERFETRNKPPSRDTEEYRQALANQERLHQGLVRILDENRVDALLYPTMRRKPAWIGETEGGNNCLLSAGSGLPAISVPAGFTKEGLPVGAELMGRSFDERRLIQLAYALEQATHHRRLPPATPDLLEGQPPSWTFVAEAVGNELVPPLATPARAKALWSFDPTTYELQYTISLSEMSVDEIQFLRLHRASRGANGPVVQVLSGPGGVDLAGASRLEEPDRVSLFEGTLYLVVYTRRHPTGELRGQLVLQ